ncbi:MAG: hypothetical protein R6V10_00710 [bacterium]
MKMVNRSDSKKTGAHSLFAFLLIMVIATAGCYIPGLGALPEADDPPEPGEPMGVEDTYFGKFIKYKVGDGKIKDFDGKRITYIVGDVEYLPSDDPDDTSYNKYYDGDEESLTFPYKEEGRRTAAGYPDAIVLDGDLRLFYTNDQKNYVSPLSEGSSDEIGDQVGVKGGDTQFCHSDTPRPLGQCSWDGSKYDNVDWETSINYIGRFNDAGDVDTFVLKVPEDNMLFRAKVQYKALEGGDNTITSTRPGEIHDIQLSLYDPDGNIVKDSAGNPLVSSRGVDYWKYRDPGLTFHIPNAPATDEYYFLKVEDLLGNGSGDSEDRYKLILESPTAGEDYKYIYRGDIQPARSGNPELDGGKTFEPDDLSTEIEDNYPDCDGIPGSGDEGDAGVTESCGSPSSFGANDGNMQYQEVDDKSAIDDGEFFIGTPTNVGSIMGAEASVIRTPDRSSLLMFISYGDRIYMLESKDGTKGLTWDLSPLINDTPALVPRKKRGGGDPEAPVVSSGRFGFCETGPAPGDGWAATEMRDGAANYGDTVPVMDGTIQVAVRLTSPRAYPDTVAISYGGNGHLDSKALKDELCSSGDCITTGADGIINTYFAPRYISYEALPRTPYTSGAVYDPAVIPGESKFPVLNYPDWSGPGNPDNPVQVDSSGALVTPLAGHTGSNQGGFLMGDDHWVKTLPGGTTLFGSTTPPRYFQEQRCTFYEMGDNFNKCAMGVPVDPATGEEPVSVVHGGDGTLDTVQKNLKGDDYLCHQGSTVGICVGNNGVFDVTDFNTPLQGDDSLEIVRDTGGPDPDALIVGIGPGPDGVLDTSIIDSYTIADEAKEKGGIVENFEAYVGGDDYCETLDGKPAICPGTGEVKMDIYTGAMTPTGSRKLISLYTLYLNGLEPLPGGYYLPKKDLYSIYDDELCIINNEIALCPGENGYFQSYRLYDKKVVDEDEDLFQLYERVKDKVDKDCHRLVAETHRDSYSETEETRYVLYRYMGARFDDKVSWSADRGFHMTTGSNGINQSCTAGADRQKIGFNQGLPHVPVIDGGTDDELQTYPLKDEKVEYDRGIYKIMTGEDGVSNSYAMGDDMLEVFMGTGAPDQPCVVASGDGVANTEAQWNDTQLYDPGDVTGFDAYSVWSPKAQVVDGEIWLYYSGLGYLQAPYATRPGAGDLGTLGECKRPGLDRIWGKRNYTTSSDYEPGGGDYQTLKFNQYLVDKDFANAVDNNNGVLLAPRIGRAVSNMKKLRADPSDWNYRNKPVMDLGKQCASSLDFPIDLPIDLPGLVPDPNYYGAFSPEIEITEAPDGESPLYLMFYTGLYVTEGDIKSKFTVGLARSLNGTNWQQIRDFNPVIAVDYFDLGALTEPGVWHGTPTVVKAGKDQHGEPSYQMFYNEFVPNIGDRPGAEYSSPLDMRDKDRMNVANRRGRVYMFCSIGTEEWINEHEKVKGAVQVLLLALPVALFLGIRFSRRKKRSSI